ncbi:PqqD family peptide modification chaperone [Blastochloris sulfoviridis]|uniref:PqqD family peptide modification chaperone n=1 Tax=Blastochloris sulfoviridis TaxID=50712 RepID=UPI001478802A|nr:PqqD family peptide modification chaperone [Blastochloris sulfoviridis]
MAARSGHLHAFSVSGRDYLVNASTGQAFAAGEASPSQAAPSRAALSRAALDDLDTFGHLDAIAPAEDGAPDDTLPPTGIGSVLLNVTHHCNLACAYCVMAMPDLQHAYRDEMQSLREDTGRACIDFLAQAGYRDGVSITFFGGEPLLKFDLIVRLVDYAEATYPDRFRYQLITNGCLMRPPMYDFFRRHRFSVLWSLDGEPEVHDRLRRFKKDEGSVFAESFAALQAFRAACPECPVGVNITYFRQTLELPAAVRFFRSHGIDAIRMDRGLVPRDSPHAVGLDETAQAKAQLTEVADDYLAALLRGEVFSLNPFVNYMRVISKRLPRTRACNAGLDYVTIAATGEIYSCYKLLGLDDCRLGDVAHGYNREASLRLWERLNVGQRPGCSACWARFICAGGCAADNRHLNGSYIEPTRENCAIALHAIELAIHLYFALVESAPQTLKALLGAEHLAADDRPARCDDVHLGADGLVEIAETGASYRLNAPAALILSLCDGAHALDDISAHLAAHYGVPEALAAMDCREQIFRMAKAGLVTIPLGEACGSSHRLV